MRASRLSLTAIVLLTLVVPLVSPSVAAVAVVARPPDGPPGFGEDKDDDQVPTNVTVHMAQVRVAHRGETFATPSDSIVVRIDHADADATQPVPALRPGSCSGVCGAIHWGDTEAGVEADLLPHRECKVGRITLCWYWTIWIEAWYDEAGWSQHYSIGPMTLLP